METLAWIGFGTLAVLVIAFAIVWLVDMLKDPLGRAFLIAIGAIVLIVWGGWGGLYLLKGSS